MGALFGGGSKPNPIPPPVAPTRDNSQEIADVAAAERRRLRDSRGRASTVLTSGQGAIDFGESASQTLLG